MREPRFRIGLGWAFIALACESRSGDSGTATPPPSAWTRATVAASASAATRAAEPIPESRRDFRRWVDEFSEPDADFISDNFLSNETSYLEIAPLLAAREKGGVYLGVGPEQNFSYIALTEPELVFLVDIRRANLLLHLLYKAAFELAPSRSAFLALILGRDWHAATEPGEAANIDAVLTHATRQDATEESFTRAHAALLKRIDGFGLSLSATDREELGVAHRTFWKEQLEVAFRLKGKSVHVYPTLRQLLAMQSSRGAVGSFLATERGFRIVQALERQDRIVPIVGDFAGKRAMPKVAGVLTEKRLAVSAFYVSNVEQYLLHPTTTWQAWLSNLFGMPWRSDGILIRAYLDQGKAHPLALPGHRTTTVAQAIDVIRDVQAKGPATSLWQLTTEHVLSVPHASRPLPAAP